MVIMQRKNFRCPRDGTDGNAFTGNAGYVISHAELPPRQRKRLQVGSTNLHKSASMPQLHAPAHPHHTLPLGSHCHHPVEEKDISETIPLLSESNMELLRVSMAYGSTVNKSRASTAPEVVRTEQRRLRSMTPSSTTARLKTLQTTAPVALSKPHEDQSIEMTTSTKTTKAWTEPSATKDQYEKFLTHRQKLYDAFLDQYGSMRAVFRAFDTNADGVITFQRFKEMIEASEVDLTPEEVQFLYTKVDTNGNNAIEYPEFALMFTDSAYAPDQSPFRPVKEDLNLNSSIGLKYRTQLELSPHSRQKMKQFRDKVTTEIAKKHDLEVSVHGGKNEKLLIHAFKQFDMNNDGWLSYDQVKQALGKDFLQLDIDNHEMDEVLRLIDRNGDQQISMKEFVQYFGVGKREMVTDMVTEGRKKELAALHAKFTAPITPRNEIDPEYYEQKAPPAPPKTLPALAPVGCLQENLIKRIAESPVFKTRPSRSIQPSNLEERANQNSRKPQMNAPVAVSQDRFRFRKLERTDWTRVGIGGDGTRPDTALYLNDTERFQTTNAQVYSPIKRGVNSGDVYRDTKATSSAEFHCRQALRQAKFDRTQLQLQQLNANRIKDERLQDWKQRVKARTFAKERFHYLDHAQEMEQRSHSKDVQMQKRHGGASFHRMWAGSADSQFNAPTFQSTGLQFTT